MPQSQLFSGSAPAAPTLLSPVAASGTQINLAWTETSTDATGFEIDRKVGAGGSTRSRPWFRREPRPIWTPGSART